MTTATNATQARQAQAWSKPCQYQAAVTRMIHEYMRYAGIYGYDEPETVIFYTNSLIRDNSSWPAEPEIIPLLTRLIQYLVNTDTKVRSPQDMVAGFRAYFTKEIRAQVFADLNEKKQPKNEKRDYDPIETWSPQKLKEALDQYQVVADSGWMNEKILPGSTLYHQKLVLEANRRGIKYDRA